MDLIRPALSPDLVEPAIARQLRAVAAPLLLPSCVGFESRLADDDPAVDIQLGYYSAESAKLATVCDAMLSHELSPRELAVWSAIRRFASSWVDPASPAGRSVSDVWLEFDTPVSGQVLWCPSFFAVLVPGNNIRMEDDLLPGLTQTETPHAMRELLVRCRELCPAPAVISHVGLMLGRQLRGCRIHASRLPEEAMGAYLEGIGWPGDIAAVLSLAVAMRRVTENVVLCLDVADRVLPQLGMECFFDKPDQLDLPWGAVLEELVGRGLCSQRKRNALLEWSGVTHPAPRQTAWPDSLILESLLQPPGRFGAIRRRLNHVKLSLIPGRAPAAKAYFGYAHEWLEGRILRAQAPAS